MADFTYTPDFAFDEAVHYKTLVSEFENGTEQRRAKWATGRREWTLRFIMRSKVEYDAILLFFTQKFGALTSFTWTNPNDSTDYTVRFKEDSFNVTRENGAYYDFEFQFIQVK